MEKSVTSEDAVDILLITAHPDDAEFGVAGSVASWTEQGRPVAYVVCTSGGKGSSDRNMTSERLIRIREKEQRAAAAHLGVSRVVFLGYEDQAIDDTPAFRKHLVEMIRTFRPHTVVTSDPYRKYIWHRDHRVLGQVVLDALFPFARDHMAYPDLLARGLEPHKVKELLLFGSEDINFHVDISDTIERKIEALACHASQMGESGIHRAEHWVRQRAKETAKGSEFSLAEGFHQVILPP
jgi:LmbE family N-acetylglucosaminyl deacetylase